MNIGKAIKGSYFNYDLSDDIPKVTIGGEVYLGAGGGVEVAIDFSKVLRSKNWIEKTDNEKRRLRIKALGD